MPNNSNFYDVLYNEEIFEEKEGKIKEHLEKVYPGIKIDFKLKPNDFFESDFNNNETSWLGFMLETYEDLNDYKEGEHGSVLKRMKEYILSLIDQAECDFVKYKSNFHPVLKALDIADEDILMAMLYNQRTRKQFKLKTDIGYMCNRTILQYIIQYYTMYYNKNYYKAESDQHKVFRMCENFIPLIISYDESTINYKPNNDSLSAREILLKFNEKNVNKIDIDKLLSSGVNIKKSY